MYSICVKYQHTFAYNYKDQWGQSVYYLSKVQHELRCAWHTDAFIRQDNDNSLCCDCCLIFWHTDKLRMELRPLVMCFALCEGRVFCVFHTISSDFLWLSSFSVVWDSRWHVQPGWRQHRTWVGEDWEGTVHRIQRQKQGWKDGQGGDQRLDPTQWLRPCWGRGQASRIWVRRWQSM